MRAFPSSLAVGLLLALSGTASVGAQQYTGTFEVPNEAGGVMTLVLQQGGDGRVGGSLSSNGVSYQVDGRIEDGMVIGSMRGTQGSLFFEAERWENELWVMLYGTDANGEPNFDDYTEIDFVEADAAPRIANPLAGQTNGNPLGGGGPDPYVGTFSDGNVTLQLQGGGGQYQGQVHVSGAAYPVQAQGDATGIQGLIQAQDGNYQLTAQIQSQGGGLIVVSGGVQYNLARQDGASGRSTTAQVPSGRVGGRGSGTGAGTARPDQASGRTSTGRELAPGFTEDHPQVREWIQFLAGNKLTRMSSYSSGSAGGYSARTDVYLCSDRSFAMRDESSVSVDVGGAFGNSGGVGNGQGRWYVITNGQVVGLVLEFADGQAQEFRMDYQNQETYANGERVFVTPAEVCGQ